MMGVLSFNKMVNYFVSLTVLSQASVQKNSVKLNSLLKCLHKKILIHDF